MQKKTQRQPDKFSKQCAICKYESNVIKYVMTDISSQIGVSTHSSKTNNEMWESRGRYTIYFCKTNDRGVGIGEDKVFWHDSKREKMQLKVSNLFIFAIQIYSHVNGFTRVGSQSLSCGFSKIEIFSRITLVRQEFS
jgi:hypothetical protein